MQRESPTAGLSIFKYKTFQRRLPQGYTTHKVQTGEVAPLPIFVRKTFEGIPGTFNSLYIPQSKVEEFKIFQKHLPQGYTTHKVQTGDSMATLIHSSYHNKNKVSKALFQGCIVLSHPSCLGNNGKL